MKHGRIISHDTGLAGWFQAPLHSLDVQGTMATHLGLPLGWVWAAFFCCCSSSVPKSRRGQPQHISTLRFCWIPTDHCPTDILSAKQTHPAESDSRDGKTAARLHRSICKITWPFSPLHPFSYGHCQLSPETVLSFLKKGTPLLREK